MIGYRAGERVLLEAGAPIPEALDGRPRLRRRRAAPRPTSSRSIRACAGWSTSRRPSASAWASGSRSTAFEPLDRLLVLGVKASLTPEAAAARLEALLDAHHYTRGLALLAPGTPTNNTRRRRPRASAARRAAASRSRSRRRGSRTGSDGAELARLLGHQARRCSPTSRAPRARRTWPRAALQTALWPVTGGYYLDQLLQPSSRSRDADARRRQALLRRLRARPGTARRRCGSAASRTGSCRRCRSTCWPARAALRAHAARAALGLALGAGQRPAAAARLRRRGDAGRDPAHAAVRRSAAARAAGRRPRDVRARRRAAGRSSTQDLRCHAREPAARPADGRSASSSARPSGSSTRCRRPVDAAAERPARGASLDGAAHGHLRRLLGRPRRTTPAARAAAALAAARAGDARVPQAAPGRSRTASRCWSTSSARARRRRPRRCCACSTATRRCGRRSTRAPELEEQRAALQFLETVPPRASRATSRAASTCSPTGSTPGSRRWRRGGSTSCARQTPRGLALGGFGWVEDLKPEPRAPVRVLPAGEEGPLFAPRERAARSTRRRCRRPRPRRCCAAATSNETSSAVRRRPALGARAARAVAARRRSARARRCPSCSATASSARCTSAGSTASCSASGGLAAAGAQPCAGAAGVRVRRWAGSTSSSSSWRPRRRSPRGSSSTRERLGAPATATAEDLAQRVESSVVDGLVLARLFRADQVPFTQLGVARRRAERRRR